MSDITFEVLKLVVMVLGIVVARYLIPWLKTSVDEYKMNQIIRIIESGVQMAQQVHASESGEARKEIVVNYVHRMLAQKGLTITEEELDTLIEAFVKQLKVAEGR